jgi:DNA/RNA endonuclease G (NUC1)
LTVPERKNAFHAEPMLPKEERAELADYEHTGFDRGHMAPSGDMPSLEAQQESFSLANIAPQTPELNRGIWEGIEAAVPSSPARTARSMWSPARSSRASGCRRCSIARVPEPGFHP